MIDLAESDMKFVRKILGTFAEGQKVVAYGSRVKGKARKFSDLDLCIMNKSPLEHSVWELKDFFSASRISVKVDVVEWPKLSPEFQAIIAEKNEVIQEGKNNA